MPGSLQEVFSQSSSNCQAVISQSANSCQALVRQLSGRQKKVFPSFRDWIAIQSCFFSRTEYAFNRIFLKKVFSFIGTFLLTYCNLTTINACLSAFTGQVFVIYFTIYIVHCTVFSLVQQLKDKDSKETIVGKKEHYFFSWFFYMLNKK